MPPRTRARVLIAVVIAAGATIVSSGTAFAQASSPVAAPTSAAATQLISLNHATRQPGDPPDCKYHPTYPGCKKKPVGKG